MPTKHRGSKLQPMPLSASASLGTGRSVLRWARRVGATGVAVALAWIPISQFLYAPCVAVPTISQQQIYQRDPLELPFSIINGPGTNGLGVTLFFLHSTCTVEKFISADSTGSDLVVDTRAIGSLAPHETRTYKCGISFPESTLTKLIVRLDFTYGVPIVPPLPWPRWTKTWSWRGDLRKRPNGELFWLEGKPLT